MSEIVTGVILAGGESRRMGEDKGLLDWGGRPLAAVIAQKLRSLCRQVVIVANDPGPYEGLADRCVPDVFPGAGVLGGLHAGLSAAPEGLVAVVGCDMPFVSPAVLERFALGADGRDAVVLRRGPHVEPLHAVYRRDALSAMEAALRSGELAAHRVLESLRVRYFTPGEIEDLDPELRCFRNVNTPGEWARARREAGFPI